MNQTYTVKSGDTLYGISNQFGVSVMDLARANNLSLTDTLSVGKTLTIPSSSGTNPNNMFIYTVKKGDSLYSIAKKYDTTANEIIKINNLKTNALSIGQQLKLPENYTKEDEMILPNYINYTVKKGDNLYSIAKLYNTTPDIIIKDNSLSNNNLSIGQNLKIRVTKDSEIIEECFGEDYIPPTTEETRLYTVKKGDSLYSIAKNYNTTIDKIKNINNLASNNLSIGQILKIPTPSINNSTIYIVKKGDSLYSIAKKYNTTIDNIKKKNNLTSNLLSVGQKIII